MKRSKEVRPDLTVEPPEELRARRSRRGCQTMSEIIERIRTNPPEERPSDSEIEDIIRYVRRLKSEAD